MTGRMRSLTLERLTFLAAETAHTHRLKISLYIASNLGNPSHSAFWLWRKQDRISFLIADETSLFGSRRCVESEISLIHGQKSSGVSLWALKLLKLTVSTPLATYATLESFARYLVFFHNEVLGIPCL